MDCHPVTLQEAREVSLSRATRLPVSAKKGCVTRHHPDCLELRIGIQFSQKPSVRPGGLRAVTTILRWQSWAVHPQIRLVGPHAQGSEIFLDLQHRNRQWSDDLHVETPLTVTMHLCPTQPSTRPRLQGHNEAARVCHLSRPCRFRRK